ncbi:sushi domain-containing protein 5 isoform X2 [Carettochelys insculpta]|uniref:sushi domain-containing protein 5 isoform X2 n=1 Tax=Carettochelys insculpta TaxID=44489 RepID=UPI003EB931B3
MARGSAGAARSVLQSVGSLWALLQLACVRADGKMFTAESRNSSQGLDLTAAQKLCATLGARLATAEELRRAVADCSFATCTRGWLADGTIGTMVCSKTGSNQQSAKAIDVNIENDPSPSGRYNALCVKDEDEAEAHIDYEDNFPDDRSMPVAEHEEERGEEEGEEEQEQEFSHSRGTEAERVGSSKDVTQDTDSTEKGSKAPTESPVSLLSQKHLFWFPAKSFNEPESDRETNDATKTHISDGNNHIGVKTIYHDAGTKMIYDSDDFPIGPVLVSNDTRAKKDAVTHTDESWLDGYPVTQEAVADEEEEGDKVDGSMGTEEDLILTTAQPNHVEVRNAGNTDPAPDMDLMQIVVAPTRMHEYSMKEVSLALTPTSAPENVSASKGFDVIRYRPTTSLVFMSQESATNMQHDFPSFKTATLKTSTTVSPIDGIPHPEAEETTTHQTQAATTTPTLDVFTDSLSNELIKQENLTYGTEEKLLPTSEPCIGEDCPSPSKGPMIAIIVIILCLLLSLAVWYFRKRQQKSSVYKLNGKGQGRHTHHHQQIEMQKV